MSQLIKPVKGAMYTPDRVGYIGAVSRQESSSDLRYSYTYKGKNKEGEYVDNPASVRRLNPWDYVGLFQFSEIALEDVGCYIKDETRDRKHQDWGNKNKKYWTNKYSASSFDVFRNSGEIQMKAIQYWIDRLCGYMRNINVNEFYGKTITGAKDLSSFEVTESGVIAARHLKGDDAVKDFLTSNGKINEVDGNKTSVGKYMSLFAHYNVQTCCKRKIYVKIVDAKKIGIPNKEVEISSEYKGTFNLGRIVVTHKTDKNGNLPIIVRHPEAKIQLKINGNLVETIIQKADQIQGYEILYLGENNYSSLLSEHKKVEATQKPNDSNSSTNNDKTSSSEQKDDGTTNITIDEVIFNIKLVEGDTGKPLPNTTYHLEYKNNIKPHKTDSSGVESGITADVSQSIGVYLDDDGGKKQSIYSMAFPVTGDLNGQTKVLKVPVVSFNIKFVDNNHQPIPHYEFKTLYRGRHSAIKRANRQGISTIKALAGEKLTVIDGQGRAQTTAIVTYGSKEWAMIIGTDITEENISDASDALNQEAATTPETSEPNNTPQPQTEQDPVIKVEKPKVTEVEKDTETGPTLEVSSDEAKITIKFVDEATNKPLSGLSYITQSTKYGKNTSVTGKDGTRGRTHDSLVGIDITVLVYEDGKEVEKDVITASADRNDIPYIYKAKKSKAKWHNPLSRMELRGWYSNTQWTPNKSDYKGRTGGKHDGLDLYAPEGTTLFACVSGIVYEYYTSDTYGHVIGIKGDYNGKTYYFFYAHLSERLFKEDEEVTAGNPIGKTGKTGNVDKKLTKGHHLHFEVRTTPNRVGGRINPYTIKELKTINKSPSKSSQR
ncbi:M23 family metallopeptidase [Psychrobacter sp. W2-37-MNA-CIBAN-0211]|jgi:murein DD-endopeptidase MepM/ murein hydrolase activator NlpD|uniref:M23 family metallopeptidase n=1 Tax=Psychrobacter sp. W2-37-MNA-CIBAN-0211 TaxID=3140443 RepID=UPI003327CBDB